LVFYQENQLDPVLRLGDIVEGFIGSTPNIASPAVGGTTPREYKIKVQHLPLCAVMTPCCSIGDFTVSLAELIPIRSSFLKNPFFAEDLTRINERVHGDKSISASDFQEMSPSAQEELRQQLDFTNVDLFVYAPNPFLQPYTLGGKIVEGKNVGGTVIEHYMIDFRKVIRVDCPEVKSQDRRRAIFPGKKAQLTVPARETLRMKLANYIIRLPNEDKALM
jgi:hypothetical protein